MRHRRPRCRAIKDVGWVVAVVLIAAGCTGGSPASPSVPVDTSAVVVASFEFPESELLAQIYGQALAANGVPVRMELDLGTREMVLPAFQQGLVDVVPEYIGSALQAVAPDASVEESETSAVVARLNEVLRPWHGRALSPSPAQDQNGLVVSRASASAYGLRTISDLRAVAGELTLTAPPECPERAYCLLGLERAYGLRFRSQIPLATEEERITALEQHVADVALAFTTSPEVARTDLVVLADDRHLQPAENLAPLVSDRVMGLYGPTVSRVLDAVSSRLDSQDLLFLNWRVSVGGRASAVEAHGWLVRHGLAARS